MSDLSFTLEQIRETSGEIVTLVRIHGAGNTLSGKARVGTWIERPNAGNSDWLDKNGWLAGAPDSPQTFTAYPDQSDLIIELPSSVAGHIDPYDTLRVTIDKPTVSARGAWLFDGLPKPREQVQPPEPEPVIEVPPPPPPPPPQPQEPDTIPLPREEEVTRPIRPEPPIEEDADIPFPPIDDEDKRSPPWLWIIIGALVALALIVGAVLWFVLQPESEELTEPVATPTATTPAVVEPPESVRDGAAILREAREMAASGDCSRASSLAFESAERHSHAPAMVALGEALDPSVSGSRCLAANQPPRVRLALDYYVRACQAGDDSGRDAVDSLSDWLSAQPDQLNASEALALDRAREECGL